MRYEIDQGYRPDATRARNVVLNGLSLIEQFDDMFTIVCSSFWRRLCANWERRARTQGFPLREGVSWTFSDTGLFLRRELADYVRERGGVTELTGAERDGRLHILRPPATPGWQHPTADIPTSLQAAL